MATTDNYNFKKSKLGHPVRDDDIGENLDKIDAAIKDREDEIDTLDSTHEGALLLDE